MADPVTGETGILNPLGGARHILDNAETIFLEHGYRVPSPIDDVPPWWFFPDPSHQHLNWIGYRFDNRHNTGVLQVVAEPEGAQQTRPLPLAQHTDTSNRIAARAPNTEGGNDQSRWNPLWPSSQPNQVRERLSPAW